MNIYACLPNITFDAGAAPSCSSLAFSIQTTDAIVYRCSARNPPKTSGFHLKPEVIWEPLLLERGLYNDENRVDVQYREIVGMQFLKQRLNVPMS